jgi:hypothetical protein
MFHSPLPSGLEIMTHTSSRPTNRQPILLSLLGLLLVTMIGVSISTASDIVIGEARPVSRSLSVDERTYYEFVAPRLDRVIVEIDNVVSMVDGKSRDIVALTVSGDRIKELTDDIVGFGATNGVPSRFADVHRLIVGGAERVTYTFDEARKALRRFNFSQMTTLVPQFDSGARTLHLAQEQMLAVVGIDPALRADKH